MAVPKIPQALAGETLQPLPAEASSRRYVRVLRPRRLSQASAVAMLFAPGTRPAEVARVARATRLLGEAGLPVPALYAVEPEQGWILQEDLGDLTLAEARRRQQPLAGAYSEAVALLGRLAPLSSLDTSPRPPLAERRLQDELHQFATVALGLPEGPGPALAAELSQLVALCCATDSVLCHRDYHSRNLLLKDGRVRVVDHQDALPGPAPYDRVSLAYDPYVDLPDAVRDRIAGDRPGTGAVAVQRLAKAIGTYADKAGPWRRSIAPAARQARRLLARDHLALPVLDLAFATLQAGSSEDPAAGPAWPHPAAGGRDP